MKGELGSGVILQGDCREVMRTQPAESVQCVVCSPPYWGLRSYGTEPAIWEAEGGPLDCEHEWGSSSVIKTGRNLEPPPSPAGVRRASAARNRPCPA